MPHDEKQHLTEYLLGEFRTFLLQGGEILPLADARVYFDAGLPATDRTLFHAPVHVPCQCESTEIVSGVPCLRPNTSNRVSLQHDGYSLRDHFVKRWLISKRCVSIRHPKVTWNDHEICFIPKVGLCLRNEHSVDYHTRLSKLITSQLLLYRILCNFNVAPKTGNECKSCWSYTFRNTDDRTCSLMISEWKGAPVAHFRGSETASTEALQLLEFLTSENCLHPYHYTRCGRVA